MEQGVGGCDCELCLDVKALQLGISRATGIHIFGVGRTLRVGRRNGWVGVGGGGGGCDGEVGGSAGGRGTSTSDRVTVYLSSWGIREMRTWIQKVRGRHTFYIVAGESASVVGRGNDRHVALEGLRNECKERAKVQHPSSQGGEEARETWEERRKAYLELEVQNPGHRRESERASEQGKLQEYRTERKQASCPPVERSGASERDQANLR